MRLVVSTCGTSLLTNNADPDTRSILNKYTNYPCEGIPSCDMNVIKKVVEKINQQMNQIQDLKQISRMSAELNRIIRIYNNQLPDINDTRNSQDIHFLIHSDTYLGQKAAEIVCNWLRTKFNNVNLYSIDKLKTDKIENFRTATFKLVEFCYETIRKYKERGYYVIFNLTGGFKSVQGIMQTLGMFCADECVYIFETGDELLRIPKLPVKLEVEETVRQYLAQFRKMSLDKSLSKSECVGIPDIYLFEVDDRVILSEWGELAWNEVKDKIYSEKLLDSPHERIVFSRQFIDSVNKLPSDRIKIINERVDQVFRFVENGENPKSLNFHRVNVRVGRSTHEFYAWSDRDAKRIYCHYEGDDKIVIDELGEHLR